MEDKIKNALKAMVAMRAAKMDPTSMRLYTARLAKEYVPDVLSALQKLAEAEREEYETAVPDIATILKLVEIERIARQNRTSAVQSQRLVAWECPDCGSYLSAFPASNDSLDRRCKGIPKKNVKRGSDGSYPICGARMDVIFDNSRTDAGPLEKWNEMPDWMQRSGAR